VDNLELRCGAHNARDSPSPSVWNAIASVLKLNDSGPA
jgi:hypothetical protein